MQQGFVQTQAQQQLLRLSPQMLQSISLMPLSAAQLRERIFEELEKNPALELVHDPIEDRNITAKVHNSDGFARSGSMSDSDAFQAFLESRSSHPETLQEHLLNQLALLDVSEEQRELCSKIIQNLDTRGFNAGPPEYLFFAAEKSFLQPKEQPVLTDEQQKLLSVCLEIVRSLEPQGTACNDAHETLCQQAVLFKNAPPLALHILQKRFELLEKPRVSLIHKKLSQSSEIDDSIFTSASIEDIEDALEFIRSLDPFPARRFFTEETTYVLPDILIRKKTSAEMDESATDDNDDDLFAVIVSGEQLPIIVLSPQFRQFTAEGVKNAQSFAHEAVKDAQWFLQALSKRNQTLVKIARALVYFQKKFFEKGHRYLAPLRLKDVADFMGVHEATVSRIANSKYIQCEWGFFEIKFFFSNALTANSGTQHSKESVKQELKLLIESAAVTGKKLSDEKLSKMLAEKGINAARRTVAKYRAELNINSSFER